MMMAKELRTGGKIVFRPFEPWDAVTAFGGGTIDATVLHTEASTGGVKLHVGLGRPFEYRGTTYREAVIEIPDQPSRASGEGVTECSLLGVPLELEGAKDLLHRNWWRGGLAMSILLDRPRGQG